MLKERFVGVTHLCSVRILVKNHRILACVLLIFRSPLTTCVISRMFFKPKSLRTYKTYYINVKVRPCKTVYDFVIFPYHKEQKYIHGINLKQQKSLDTILLIR